jgi:hypothetical protein
MARISFIVNRTHNEIQNASRNPTCSRRMALAVRMTPKVDDVAPDGTDAPG